MGTTRRQMPTLMALVLALVLALGLGAPASQAATNTAASTATSPSVAPTTVPTSTATTDRPTTPSSVEPTTAPTTASTTERDSLVPPTSGPLAPPTPLGSTPARRIGRTTEPILYMRDKPTRRGAIVARLTPSDRVLVLDEVKTTDDSAYPLWVHVRLEGTTVLEGYVAKDYLIIETEGDVISNEAFERHLAAEGFPESYKVLLRRLFAKHPTWIFRAYRPKATASGAGVTSWSEALAQESRPAVSMVPLSSDPAWKSYDPLTYDYRNDRWLELDAGWTGASPEAVAYYLDPRNFLNERQIFQFETLRYDAAVHTQDAVRKAQAGSFMATSTRYATGDGAYPELDHAGLFWLAGWRENVSPLFLTHRSLMEVSRRGSRSVSGTDAQYPGVYNYYNIGAYADPHDPIRNALAYAKAKGWTTRYGAIRGGAAWIKRGYIDAEQHTTYLQKFDLDATVNGAYWHQYMGNLRAPSAEAEATYETYSALGMLDLPFVFWIPVLADMPPSPMPRPNDNRSRNNYLSSLGVSGTTNGVTFVAVDDQGRPISGVKTFNPERMRYMATIPSDQDETTIVAVACHPRAKVLGGALESSLTFTATFATPPGTTTLSIPVDSERGDRRVYQIVCVRQAPPSPPSPTGPAYQLSGGLALRDGHLVGWNTATMTNLVATATRLITPSAGVSLRFLDAAGQSLSAKALGTGCRVVLTRTRDQAILAQWTVVLYGDVTGDGAVNANDMYAVFLHRMGRRPLTGLWLKAADVDRNGKIDANDINAIFLDRMRKRMIDQR